LATDCDRILEGEAIPAGSPAAMNEITSLENTFKSMSLTLSKNEKRRKSFQELFQNVLAGSLNTVESGLSRALNVIQRSPNASLQSAPDLKKMIERCKNGLEHLQAILKSLTSSLDATDDKELVLNLEEVNVALLVERSLLSVEALAKERHIVAVEELTPFAVHGDNQLMQRVITNFLSNAIKYSPTNGKVTIQVEDQASAWQLSVRDEGPGISPLERKKLFTQFGQLESPDGKKRAGTGLGLVICKEIIEAHGGVVSCESTPGNGSKFWFRMPKSGMPVQRFTLSSSDTRAKEAPLTSNNKPRVMSAQKATTPIKRTARHRISIYFLSLMFVFLASQILAVCALAGRFQQIHKQAAIFSTQKDRFLKTQGCLVSLINGRLKIISDFEDDNMPAVKKTLGLIQSLEFPSPGDLATGNTEIDQQVEERIALIDRHKKFMVKTVESLPNSMADVSKLQMAMIYPSANKAFKQLEDDCYSLMDVGKQGIRNSYAVSSNLRNQIVSALFLDLFVNTLILALAVKYTINLVSRVNSLSGKAARFMDGKLPVPDQKGDDELSWLDERFCQQASQLQSSEEKEQALMAVVNHDLRTPINSILLTLENLAADTTLASESDLTTALNGSRAELLALFKRINNFLLIEKLQHSSTKLKAEKLAFDGLMEGVLEMMSSSNLIDSGRLQMEFEDPDDDWFIEGDARLIESMLVEIITNAFQYSLAGSQVELHCSKNKSGQLELDIINRCRAINAELAPYIFERYRSVQGATIHGIGLPLVAAIAILHKGEVQLLSNNAHGCIFRIELPLSA
jgi:signal transduction histidine kinase